MITPLVNPSNYCFGNAVVQLLSLLKLSWDNCPDLASLLQTMRQAQGTVSAKNFITSMGFNPNNPSDAMALLNRVLTQENPEETRWRTQVFDNYWQPGDPPGSRAEPQRDEHSILIDGYEDTLEEAITTSLVKHHVTGFVNKTKHIMSYPKIAIFELGCNRRRRGCKLPNNLTLGNHNYTLAATINFVGKATKNGHYTAITKSKDGWALCNDSAITRVSEDQVHQITEGINERAIGVCYTRTDVELNIKSSGDNNPNPWVMPKPKPKPSKDKQHDILFFGPNRGQHPIISIRRLLEYIGAHEMATQEMVWEKDNVNNNEHIRIRASAEARYAFNFKIFTWRVRSVCGDWRFCPQDPTPTFMKFTKHVNAQAPVSKKTPPKKCIDFGPLPVQWKTPDNSYTRTGMDVHMGAWNLNNMKNRLPELARMLTRLQIDILAVQESLQDKTTTYQGVITDNYEWLHPQDHMLPTSPGGNGTRGTGFWVRKTMLPHITQIPSDIEDTCWIQLKTRDRGTEHCYLVGSVYLPVHNKKNAVRYKDRLKRISRFIKLNRHRGKVRILGDLNAHIGAGNSDEDVIGEFNHEVVNEHGIILREFLESNSLNALNGRKYTNVPEYTRFGFRKGKIHQSVVDFVVVDDTDTDTNSMKVWDSCHLDGTDHYLLTTNISMGKFHRKRKIRRVRKRVQFEKLIHNDDIRHKFRDQLEEQGDIWKECFKHNIKLQEYPPNVLVKHATSCLNHILRECAKSCCGVKKIVDGRSKDWWDQECTDMHKRFNLLHIKYKKGQAKWKEYTDFRRKWHKVKKRKIKDANKREFEKFNDWADAKDNRFWNILKRIKNGQKKGVREVISGNKRSTDKKIILKEFTAHYAQLALESNLNSDPNTQNNVRNTIRQNRHGKARGPDIMNGAISIREVTKVRRKLYNGKAPGMDGINGELLKYGKHITDGLLHTLFSYCFEHETVDLEIWRTGKIVNLYKSGDAADPGNYRGITLFSIVGKLYAKILCNRIGNHLETNGLLSESQNGFRTRGARNCVEHCFSIEQICSERKRNKLNTFLFFMDLRKAFDTVWHDGLMHKLHEVGVRGKIWRVVRNFYGGTRSMVSINNHEGTPFPIQQGVAQGCPLSPILFSVFVNDLLVELETKGLGLSYRGKYAGCLAFADDFVGIAESKEELQKIIDVCREWTLKWKMQANMDLSSNNPWSLERAAGTKTYTRRTCGAIPQSHNHHSTNTLAYT